MMMNTNNLIYFCITLLMIVNNVITQLNPEQHNPQLKTFSNTILPDRTVCGIQADVPEIWGGKVTYIKEFPWLAALEYINREDGNNAGIRCGGTLITNRYVLTAAHCIKYIRPICLPLENYKYATYDTYMTIAGWGFTENETMSDVKLKVDVPILKHEKFQKKIFRKPIGVNQLCAGGELGKDACIGDSGGPLMKMFLDPLSWETNWFQEGIISYGVGCAQFETPAVYTRIDRYVVWIINTIIRSTGNPLKQDY